MQFTLRFLQLTFRKTAGWAGFDGWDLSQTYLSLASNVNNQGLATQWAHVTPAQDLTPAFAFLQSVIRPSQEPDGTQSTTYKEASWLLGVGAPLSNPWLVWTAYQNQPDNVLFGFVQLQGLALQGPSDRITVVPRIGLGLLGYQWLSEVFGGGS